MNIIKKTHDVTFNNVFFINKFKYFKKIVFDQKILDKIKKILLSKCILFFLKKRSIRRIGFVFTIL